MKKKNILVVCGGLSSERDISLVSGAQVFKTLEAKKYNVFLVDVSSTGWKILDKTKSGDYLKKAKRVLSIFSPTSPTVKKICEATDVAFLALHGVFGEDGQIQAFFEQAGIPYTGSGVMASSLAMDKYRSTCMAEYTGVLVPKSTLIFKHDFGEFNQMAKHIQSVIGFPCFVKPNRAGSSVGAGLVRDKKQLQLKLQDAFSVDGEVIVQAYMKGRELTCAVVGNTGEEVVALPPVEIQTQAEFFDRLVKYDSKTVELCPAPLSKTETKQIQELASVMHQVLGCRGVTRSDFILVDDAFYYLETNTIPGLTETSLAPKEAKAFGISFSEYLDLQIEMAA